MEKVKIKLNGGIMPTKGSEYAAAYDVYVPEDVVLKHGRQVVDLKFQMELPHGYAAIIQPRSGFASKGMECFFKRDEGQGKAFSFIARYRLDADVIVGLVDEDYRGSVGVLVKVSEPLSVNDVATIEKGTRIAQMRIVKVHESEIAEVTELDMTNDRGGGYGHTGTK